LLNRDCKDNPVKFVDPSGLSSINLDLKTSEKFIENHTSSVNNIIIYPPPYSVSNNSESRNISFKSDSKAEHGKTSESGADEKEDNRRSLPVKGKPNSKDTLYNPDGSKKQERYYGPDGLPEIDIDYSHEGNVTFPHSHTWKDGARSREHAPVPENFPNYISNESNSSQNPSTNSNINWGEVATGAVVIITGIAIVIITGGTVTPPAFA
jgi:hypothetical protein